MFERPDHCRVICKLSLVACQSQTRVDPSAALRQAAYCAIPSRLAVARETNPESPPSHEEERERAARLDDKLLFE
jgi:hypothetical protein